MTPRGAPGRSGAAAAPWRLALVAYAAALATATHWPELPLGGGASPWPDKLLHLAAFGALAVLMVQARFTRAWIALAFAAVWTVADELTQATPGLGRTVSAEDALAGLLGVALAAAWTAALRPVGGAASRMRFAWVAFLLGGLWRRWTTWVAAAFATGVVGAAVGAAAGLVLRTKAGLTVAESNRWAFVAAALAGLAALHLVLALGTRRRAAAIRESRPCLECGASCADVSFDDFGRGRCPGCAAAVHRGQWTEPMELPASVVFRDAAPALFAAAGLLLSAVFAYGILLLSSAYLSIAKRVLLSWERLEPDLKLACDLTAVGVIAAVAVGVYRRAEARRYDLQHRRCRCCGHDLSATPMERGQGRCGECGLTFVRVAEQPEAAKSDGR